MLPSSSVRFTDRTDAGRRLAARLERYRGSGALLVALPRGGVVLAGEVAGRLGLPLEVLIVRKIGHPHNPEFGVGAVVEDAAAELDVHVLGAMGMDRSSLEPTVARARAEITRRRAIYREGRNFPDVTDRTIVLIDDGVATGHTVRSAIRFLRARHARTVVLAIGVAPPEAIRALRAEVDDLVCLLVPPDFEAVGQFYEAFDQVTDDQVVRVLERFALSGARLGGGDG